MSHLQALTVTMNRLIQRFNKVLVPDLLTVKDIFSLVFDNLAVGKP